MAVTAKFEADFASFHSAVDTATTKLRSFETGAGQAGTAVGKMGDHATVRFKDMAVAAGAIAGIVTGVAAAITKLGERGADVSDVRDSFVSLTGAIGESADVMLGRLQAATLGNVSNFELMKTVNQGLSQGLQLTADQMGLTGDVAAVLADRVGIDVSQAFNTMIQAMATGQDRQLKQVGLNIDAAAAASTYAASLGKTAAELTEAERKHAIVNAILAEGQQVLALSGKAQEDFADKVGQSQVKLSNVVDGIGEWVATSPAIGTWSSVITGVASTVTALGLSIGPLSAGVTKLLPMLGLSGGLSGLLGSVGISAMAASVGLKAVWVAVTGPVGLVAGAVAAVVALNQLKTSFNNLPPGLQQLAQGTRSYREDIDLAAEATQQYTDVVEAVGPPIQNLKKGLKDAEEAAKKKAEAVAKMKEANAAAYQSELALGRQALMTSESMRGLTVSTGLLADAKRTLTARSLGLTDVLVKQMPEGFGYTRGAMDLTGVAVDDLGSRITGHLTTSLQSIPQIFIDAFTGGGGVIGALKGIGVSLLNAIVKEILDPIMKSVANWAGGIARMITGALSQTAFGMPVTPGMIGGPPAGAAGGMTAGGMVLGAAQVAGWGIVGYTAMEGINALLGGNTGVTPPSGYLGNVDEFGNPVYTPPDADAGRNPPPELGDRFLGAPLMDIGDRRLFEGFGAGTDSGGTAGSDPGVLDALVAIQHTLQQQPEHNAIALRDALLQAGRA